MMGEVIKAAELEETKKHNTFHVDVITGRTGDYATNAVTGQVQKTLPATVNGIDWTPKGNLTTDNCTFTKPTDYAVDDNGTQWAYNGTFPFTSTAPVVPSAPDYYVVHVSDHNALSGLGDADSHPSSAISFDYSQTGSVLISQQDLNTSHVNAGAFTDLQDAVNYASSVGKKLVVDGDWNVPSLTLTYFNYDKPWNVEFNGQITVVGDLRFEGMANCHIKGGTFIAGQIYLQGIRYSSFANMELRGPIKMGRWDGAPAGASWSFYWNRFTSVQFDSIRVRTSISNACSINNNTFDTCTFRDKALLGQLIEIDVFPTATDPAMTANTFVGCDWSYADAWNFLYNYGRSFSAKIIGGFLDTGTNWYKPGSFFTDFDFDNIRNPSALNVDPRWTSAAKTTIGSARPQKSLPVSAKSLLKNPPASIAGVGTKTYSAVPMPHAGEYTVNVTLKNNGVSLGAWKVKNNTTAFEVFFTAVDGHFSCTFEANQGDLVDVLVAGAADMDVEIIEFSITAGTGVYQSIPIAVHSPYEYDSGVVSVSTTPVVMATIPIGANALRQFEVLVNTRAPVTAGGGERILLNAIATSGGSAALAVVDEISRVLVNGLGGTSDDPAPVTVTTTNTGTSINILLNTSSGTVNARLRAKYADITGL